MKEVYAQIPGPVRLGIKLFVGFIVLLIAYNLFTARVDGGDTCAVRRFGKAVSQAGPGLHFKLPVDTYVCYTGRVQTLDILMDEDATSEATYSDVAIKGVTNTAVEYDASLALSFVIPTENVKNIYNDVGKTDRDVYLKGINQPLRTVTRQVLNRHAADELYFGNLTALSEEILKELEPIVLQEYGIEIRYFGLKEFSFDKSYTDRIKTKNEEIENAKIAELQQVTATENAETARIVAEGNATAAARGVEIAATAEGNRITTIANAEASAETARLTARSDALAGNPDLLKWEMIGAITSANVIYLPSDTGILPIMDITPTTDTGSASVID